MHHAKKDMKPWLFAGGGFLAGLLVTVIGFSLGGESLQGYLRVSPTSQMAQRPAAVPAPVAEAIPEGIKNFRYGVPTPTTPDPTLLTRAQIAEGIMLVRKITNIPDIYTNCFPDTVGHKSEKAICYLAMKGFINSYPDGSFQPDSIVNRAEAAKLVTATLLTNLPLETSRKQLFKDVTNADWFDAYVDTLTLKNLADIQPKYDFAGNPIAMWYPGYAMTLKQFNTWMKKQPGPQVTDRQCMAWLKTRQTGGDWTEFMVQNKIGNLEYDYCVTQVIGEDVWNNS